MVLHPFILMKLLISLLSAKELEVINETLERLSSMNATQISAYSHLDIPWKVTEDKEIIDYELTEFERN
ncbi:MAG: DUF4065 domain-containing protein [Theionarchaea archaeon]|nr:MAG: hypothetical protein AYK18_15045 [Theionarchaea archaeon DG-70]MBU7009132.1 DUF4065 domain-containing protein [Theionarchaea archaeon]